MKTVLILRPDSKYIGTPTAVRRSDPDVNHIVARDAHDGVLAECGLVIETEDLKTGFAGSLDAICERCVERMGG